MTVLRSALAALVLLAAAAGVASTASGQIVVTAKGEHSDPRLRQTWTETEGDWHGTWTPTNASDPDGSFNANWHKPREVAHATLLIHVSGQIAIVERTQPDGQHCTYRGTFNEARNYVSGTYTCDWARTPMAWSATVAGGSATTPTDTRPSFDNTYIYLALRWRETEGVWRAIWTPTNPEEPDGHFTGHWTHERESASATLFVQVQRGTGHVHVLRRDPNGRTCDYDGQIASDFFNMSGQYYCSDSPRRLPWSAQLIRNN